MTLEQVGQIIGVTKERVRQIQNKAMEKIKRQLEINFLGMKAAELPPLEGEAGAAEGAIAAPLSLEAAELKYSVLQGTEN